MFMTLYALLLMPVASVVYAFITLYGLGITQNTTGTIVVKGQANKYIITLENLIYIGFGTAQCIFIGEQTAIDTDGSAKQIGIRPFMKPYRVAVDFTVKYRGVYQLGLSHLEVRDFLGLFVLRRNISTKFEIVAYPRISDLEHMELAAHLLSKAPANLAVAQEDYADYTDVRAYVPSDPIKKVHWKLTAKRGEWMVKNYQSSVLNSMAILLDSRKRMLPYDKIIALEDAMMEQTVGILRYCLRQQMPIDLLFGRHVREAGRHIGDFDALYNNLANLSFIKDDYDLHDVVSGYLNETSYNVNVVILTSQLDTPLYERILNAVRFGHYIAIMYFVPEKWARDRESDAIFEKLHSSGLNCVQI